MTNHYCVRVYANGEAKHTIRPPENTEKWVAYNREARCGNGLFVDGKVVAPGYLTAAEVVQVEQALQAELAQNRHDLSKPEPMGNQVDKSYSGLILGRYYGYAEERLREGFKFRENA